MPSVVMCVWGGCVQEMVSAITTAVAMASSPGREAQVATTRQKDPLTHPSITYIDTQEHSFRFSHRYHSRLLTHLSLAL